MDLQRHAERELLRYAVQTAITCSECGSILDARRAILLTVTFDGTETHRCVCERHLIPGAVVPPECTLLRGSVLFPPDQPREPKPRVRKPKKVIRLHQYWETKVGSRVAVVAIVGEPWRSGAKWQCETMDTHQHVIRSTRQLRRQVEPGPINGQRWVPVQ